MTDIWKEHKKLYHYTNWDGLSGILKTSSLWATHYRFLNDSSEFTLFGDKLISLLKPGVDEEHERRRQQESNTVRRVGDARDPNAFAADFVKILINNYYRVTKKEIYITSFCGQHRESSYVDDNGLLSQWRAYGAGGGFALVFDTRKLWDLIDSEVKRFPRHGMHLSTCVYSDDEDTLQCDFSAQIATLSDSAKRFAHLALTRNVNQDDRVALYTQSLWPFLCCCTRYNHCGFKEENEVRLVIVPPPLAAVKDGTASIARQFRDGNGERIPYVSLFDSTSIEPAMERIIVGPHKEKEARAAALRTMVGDRQEVTCSDIPFVG